MTQVPEDEPLDPAVEKVRARLARMQLISGGIMVVGLMTVAVALVYRLNRADAPDPANPVPVMAGSVQVQQMVVEGTRIVLVIRRDGETFVRVQTLGGALVSETKL